MKKLAKKLVVGILGWQVRRLRAKNDFRIIAVVGSIGKTSTKMAIAKVLGASKKVRYQEGNYNDIVSVPLIFFDQPIPSLFNPIAWLKVFLSNETQIKKPYPYDFVVVEIGTDGPGQIAEYGKYLVNDLTVVAAITPEHMENFDSLADVAAEELSVDAYSVRMLLNTDLCDPQYENEAEVLTRTYGLNARHNKISKPVFKNDTAKWKLKVETLELQIHKQSEDEWYSRHESTITTLELTMPAVSMAEVYSASAAAIVAKNFGVTDTDIKASVVKLKPVSGRMQRLKGINNSIIFDDTYNASPDATIAALDVLYKTDAPQKIALLGNMNELGKVSADAHKEIGEYCDPKKLDLVITLGPDANKYLAAAAEAKGCKVKSFDDPYSAGEYIKSQVKSGALILAKGSQNKVFAEEAIKALLANKSDAKKLVRQSDYWMKIKQKGFKDA